jgi:hypothetical protein
MNLMLSMNSWCQEMLANAIFILWQLFWNTEMTTICKCEQISDVVDLLISVNFERKCIVILTNYQQCYNISWATIFSLATTVERANCFVHVHSVYITCDQYFHYSLVFITVWANDIAFCLCSRWSGYSSVSVAAVWVWYLCSGAGEFWSYGFHCLLICMCRCVCILLCTLHACMTSRG